MSIMEMCECEGPCGEMLEPMTYKQSAAFVSVPTMLGAQPGQPGSLLQQLSTAVGPNCPLPSCPKQMCIQRYLMQPMPQVIGISLTYDSMGAAAFDSNILSAVFSRVETEFDLQTTYKGVAQPTVAKLVGMLYYKQDSPSAKYGGFFLDAVGGQWVTFDEATASPIGPDWTTLTSHCTQNQLQPAILFYQLQPGQAASSRPGGSCNSSAAAAMPSSAAE